MHSRGVVDPLKDVDPTVTGVQLIPHVDPIVTGVQLIPHVDPTVTVFN